MTRPAASAIGRRSRAWLAAGALVAGCAGTPPPPPPVPPPRAVEPPPPRPPAPPDADASAVPSPAAEPSATPAPPITSSPVFPPPAFGARYERTAGTGDGTWTPVAEAPLGGGPVMFRTTVHPHPIKPFVAVVVVAIDRTRTELGLVAGTLEPLSKTVPPERRPGLVPAADQPDLLAVFNGGFMARHGGFGMKVGADTFLPPRDESCTVALYADGRLRIAPYSALKADEASLAAYRQTPPCLVEGGTPSPDLDSHELARKWGAAEGGNREVRRSSLGLDDSGRTLFYALGESVTAKDLAEAIRAAGATSAAELDINWSYTRFLFYAHPAPGRPPEVSGTLIPKMKHPPRGYVVKPSERDFFYLKLRR